MRRTRVVVGLLVVVTVGVVVGFDLGASTNHRRAAAVHVHRASRHLKQTVIPATESGLLPWHLVAPISRSVVLPGSGNQLVLLGGLTTGNTSSSGIYTLDTSDGSLSHVGDLTGPLHDAAAAVVGSQDVVFGGGATTTVGTVQAFPAPGATSKVGAPGPTAAVVASLPSPRSDAAEVTIGTTSYVVGGYDGVNADAAVLATTDGHSFRSVASLPIPVRYPAVSALRGEIYVFGGQAITGDDAGNPVDTVQVIDPGRHTATIAGHLPEPLSGAVAVTLAGHLYVLGGESTVPQPATTGIGSTQLGPSSTSNPGAGKSGAITDGYLSGLDGPPATSLLTDTKSRQSSRVGPTAHLTSSTATSTVSSIWAFDPTSARLELAGHLQVPISHAGVAVIGSTAWLIGGESGGTPVTAVQMLSPNTAFGMAGAPGAGSPYFGAKLLIADRGNNRLLLLDSSMHILWTYPSSSSASDPLSFYFPDDAFFIDKGSAIISNQEQNETIVEIGYPSGKILWSYGHPKQPGTAPGYLHEPDDAYLLKDGQITVADAENCRVLVLNADGTVADQIGTNGVCVHNPPTSMGSPNGDTPLADGNLLVSEINGSWVTEFTPHGNVVWTVHLPISYPSDPQQVGPNLYLLADYSTPGQILEFNRSGTILYRYDVASGPGMLDHPSLAELLPSGAIMTNDDYRNRMVAFDPRTGALVWQYGINDQAGTSSGMLNTPDGFDLLLPDGSTPTHPATG